MLARKVDRDAGARVTAAAVAVRGRAVALEPLASLPNR
jgi:hypothetical protein